MAITSVKDSNSVILGLGTLGLATYPGSSPVSYTDVGYIKSMNVAYSREMKDFTSNGTLIKRLVFRDTFVMTANWAEVSISNFKKLWAPGLTYDNGTGGGMIEFGGNRTITRYLARYEFVRDDGKTVTADIFKCTPTGESTLGFAEEDYVTFPVELAAEADSARSSGRQYGRFTIGT